MKLLALISEGIDSPVAAYMMDQAGADVVLLHMDNAPYSDEVVLENVKTLAETLRTTTGHDFPLYVVPHGATQDSIGENCDYNYRCVMCKRLMQHTAKLVAEQLGCSGIIMGDSLGQVASQTLKNIRSENHNIDFPIIRPLIGYDKLEIEAIAKEIGTYEISIRPGKGCNLVPVKPITEAKLDKILKFDEVMNIEVVAKTSADGLVRI